MVKSIFLGAALALLAGIGCAKDVCTAATEFQPMLCRIKLPRIVGIEIEKNGARSSPTAEPSLDCARFTLTGSKVRRYFNQAWQVKHIEDEHHTLDALPCYASGTMRFADGRKAAWYIEQSQTGSLVFDSEEPLYLYCPSCKFTPFSW